MKYNITSPLWINKKRERERKKNHEKIHFRILIGSYRLLVKTWLSDSGKRSFCKTMISVIYDRQEEITQEDDSVSRVSLLLYFIKGTSGSKIVDKGWNAESRYDDRRRNKEKAKAGIWCSYIASYDHETSSITFPFPYLDLFPIRPIDRTTIFLPSRTVHLHFWRTYEMKATGNPIPLTFNCIYIDNVIE